MSASRAMTLHQLLAGFAYPGTAGAVLVQGLSLDSRTVSPGYAFVALQGAQQHGITFAPAALAQGASVILAEKSTIDTFAFAVFNGVPVVWITALRQHLGTMAARFFGEPSRELQVIGVTGTNGKTSTVQLLAQIFSHLGQRTATIGTLGAGLYGELREGERTTPDAIAVHERLAEFRDAGATHVAIEVSSHALQQGRVNGVNFNLAVFTNLTRDHLDYHGSMDAYGAAKAKLFTWPDLDAAIINVDDAFGRELVHSLTSITGNGGESSDERVSINVVSNIKRLENTACITYGINHKADISAHDIRTDITGITFQLHTPWGQSEVSTRLLGHFNVSNLLAVAACLGHLGFRFEQICAAITTVAPVAGRMNRLGGEAPMPLVVVDYAHTPDALEQALTSLRAHCTGRLICVFGCGGERDKGKRSQMGAIAERLSDEIVITDDNPRNENGDAIITQIKSGLIAPDKAMTERDRARAIAHALHLAHAGDVVLIAGKGHESYQEVANVKYPFDDISVARKCLEMQSC